MGRGFAALERTRQVELQLTAEHVVGCVDQLPYGLVVGATDVVDPDVETTELGPRGLGEVLGEVADVALDDHRPPATVDDTCSGLPKVSLAAGVDDHVRPSSGESRGDAAADALTRTGDDGDLAVDAERVEQAHTVVQRSGRLVNPCKTNDSLRTSSTAQSHVRDCA